MRIFIGLSRIFHVDIAHEIVISKITTVNLHYARSDLRCRTASLDDKIYDVELVADRFRFLLTTFELCVFIRISRLSSHIVYGIAIVKITAEFCRISNCLA